MRAICAFYCSALLALALTAIAREDFKLTLYEHQSYGGTNVWLVAKSRLDKLPSWKFGDGEPPLPVGKAAATAKAWLVSRGCSTNSCVVEVTIRPVSPYEGEFQGICYYNFLFGNVGLVGHYQRCLVLMDGTIVEPGWLGTPPKNISDYAQYDE